MTDRVKPPKITAQQAAERAALALHNRGLIDYAPQVRRDRELAEVVHALPSR